MFPNVVVADVPYHVHGESWSYLAPDLSPGSAFLLSLRRLWRPPPTRALNHAFGSGFSRPVERKAVRSGVGQGDDGEVALGSISNSANWAVDGPRACRARDAWTRNRLPVFRVFRRPSTLSGEMKQPNALRHWFYVEVILSVSALVLAVVTLLWNDWIEIVFKIDPDSGNGSLERGIVAALVVAAIACAWLARTEWRRARTPAITGA